MRRYTIHPCISVRGLLSWDKRKLRGATKWMLRADGTRYTLEQLREALMDELAQGHEVIPAGECDRFDFKKGCLGHDIEDQP